MDKDDVVARFMHDKFLFPRRDMAGMCHVDYVKNIAVVAVVGEIGFEKIIGVGASFFQPAGNTVEVAFSVLKDHGREREIASILMKLVDRAAKKGGIKGMVAYTLPENQRMIRLFHSLPYKVTTSFTEGMVCLRCRFDEAA